MNIEPDALKGIIPNATAPSDPRNGGRPDGNAVICDKTQFISSSREQMEHHPTTAARAQWRRAVVAKQPGDSRLRSRPAKPQSISATTPGPHLVLVGERHMLRALRAAEMAAWNAKPPVSTKFVPHASPQVGKSYRLPAPQRHKNEGALLALLGLAALVSVCIGIQDMNALLTGWSHMVNGIRSLLL